MGKVVRLSEETGQLIDRLQGHMLQETGVELTKTQVVALALRRLAESLARDEEEPVKRKPASWRKVDTSSLPPTQVQTMPLGPTTMTAPPPLSYENDEPAPLEPSVAAFVERVKPQAYPRVFKPQPKKGAKG